LAPIICFVLCALAVWIMVLLMPRSPVPVESEWYLYDATGHGWTCLRANEQMDVDTGAGAYPDGTQVAVLEKIDDGLFETPRYKMQIGRAIGWVFEDEMLTEDMWLQKKESGQYVPFQSQWIVDRNQQSTVPVGSSGNTSDATIISAVTESSFTALGIYLSIIHAQFSNMDGFLSVINSTSADYDTFAIHSTWVHTMQRAIHKAKGTDEARWTEMERQLLDI